MRKEGLENLTLRGQEIEEGSKPLIRQGCVNGWPNGRQETLQKKEKLQRTTRDGKLWRSMKGRGVI